MNSCTWVGSRHAGCLTSCLALADSTLSAAQQRALDVSTSIFLQDANLWDTSIAPTAVMTQLGARTAFQRQLQDRGVEVVQFDFLTPEGVAAYCHERGFLQVGPTDVLPVVAWHKWSAVPPATYLAIPAVAVLCST